jgi:prepilin-type N-terminal cleavage/methylation domain-containing protein
LRVRYRRTRHAGFTLIEMLAVVAIFTLLAAFVAPNLGVMRNRALKSQALQLAAQLEFARARAVMTGAPHRMLFDADDAAYRLEWMKEEVDPEAPSPVGFPRYDVNGASPLPLAAPTQETLVFRPVPGRAGSWKHLADDLEFAGFQTDDGWLDSGEVYIAFDRDGTTSYTELQISDEGGKTIVLDVLPIAEAVRVRDDEG